MSEKMNVVYAKLLEIHELAFKTSYEGEENPLTLALLIRNHWKGNHSIPTPWRNRFHRVILEMERADRQIGKEFMAGCR